MAMKIIPKISEFKNAYMVLYLIGMYQLYFIVRISLTSAYSSAALKCVLDLATEITITFAFKTFYCNYLSCCTPVEFPPWFNTLVMQFPRIVVYFRLIAEFFESDLQTLLYQADRMSLLFFFTRYIFSTYQIIFLKISSAEQVYLLVCYAVSGALQLKAIIPNFMYRWFYLLSLVIIPLVYIFVVNVSRHPNEDIESHVRNLNRMALILKTAFVNSLPKRLIPLVIKNQRLPCEIAQSITTVYIHIKNDDSLLSDPESHAAKLVISRINFLLCLFDFLAEVTCVYKIKSSYSYYMACSGAKTHFTGDAHGEVTDYKQQFHLLATFCLACQEAAQLLNITISAGITSGNAVIGVIGLEDSNVNLDIYGDTINLSARIARNAECGVYFALRDSNTCRYFKVNAAQREASEPDSRAFADLLSECSYEDVKHEILAMKPGYCFGRKLVKNYKGKGEKSIIEIVKTEFFEQDFQSVFAKALYKLFDHAQRQNDYDNEDFIAFLNQIDLLKRRSQLNLSGDVAQPITNSVEKCATPVSYSDMISQTMQLVRDIGKAKRIILNYNKKLAVQEQKVYYEQLHVNLKNTSGIYIQESLSQQLFSRTYQIETDRQLQEQEHKLKDNLIDEAIDSDDENDSPIKLQQRWVLPNNVSASTSTMKCESTQEPHNSSSSIIENMLKPKLASFLEIARNTNEIRKVTHSSSGQNCYIPNSRHSSSQVQHLEAEPNDSTKHQEEKSDTFAPTPTGQVKLAKGLSGLSHIAHAMQHQNTQHKAEINHRMDVLYNYSPTSHDIKTMGIYKSRQLFSLSNYCKKQLQEDMQYYYYFVSSQKPQVAIFLLAFYMTFQFLIQVSKHFESLPELSFVFFGIPFSFRRFRQLNNWFLIGNMLSYVICLRDYFSRQRAFLRRPRRQTASELLESCGGCLNTYYQVFLVLYLCLHASRQYMYFDLYRRYKDAQVFDYFMPLSFLFLSVECAAFVAVMSLLLSHRVAPVLLLSSGLGVFFGGCAIFSLYTLVRAPSFGFLVLFQILFIIAFTLPGLRQHIYITQLNFRLSQQINSGRELLSLILPTITMDSLLAASAPDDLPAMLAQFPFLSGYTDSIIRLYSFEEAAAHPAHASASPPSSARGQGFFTPRGEMAMLMQRLHLAPRPPLAPGMHASPLNSPRRSPLALPSKLSGESYGRIFTKAPTQPVSVLAASLMPKNRENEGQSTPQSADPSLPPTPKRMGFTIPAFRQFSTLFPQTTNGNGFDSTQHMPRTPTSRHADLSKLRMNEARNDLQELFCGFLLFPNPLTLSQRRPLINFRSAAYLNLDIANFTEFASRITVEQTLAFLTELYRLFDARIRQSPDLIQIKISGDSYELMGLPCTLKRYDDSARVADEFVFNDADLEAEFGSVDALRRSYDAIVALVATGLGFIDDCRSVLMCKFPYFAEQVALRVGVAFGAVAGALLGDRLCRFDVFGSVSKQAEQCQEAARANTVCVSAGVKKILAEGERAFVQYINRIYAQEEAGGERKIVLEDEFVKFVERDGFIVGIQ